MTDYNVGISKIYQFIKNNIKQMDLDGNGEIIEAECKYFLKEAINNGEISLEKDDKPGDLVATFWKKINTNKGGKSIVSLDSKELDSMNDKIKMYDKFEEYFNNNIVKNLSSNKYITDTESREKWIKSVKESLLDSVDKFISKGGKAEQLEAFLSGKLDNKYYADPTRKNLAQLAMNKTTANIYAQNYIKQQLGDIGATFSDLQKMIDNLITKEIGDSEMTDSVIAKTKGLVDDYLAQASGNYSFSETEKEKSLTEYQGYKLKNQLTNVMKDISKEEGYAENKELYDGAVSSYIDSLVSESKKGEYNKNIKLSYSDIFNSDGFKEVRDKIEMIKDLKQLPSDFWDNLPEKINIVTGGSISGTYSIPNSYTTPKGVVVETSRMKYTVSGGSNLSVSSDGAVTINGASKESVNKATVTVTVDDIVVATRTVTITSKNLTGSDVQADASKIYYDDIGGYKNNDKMQVINRSGYGVSANELKPQVKKKIDEQLKPELIVEMKRVAKNLGVSYDKIESYIDTALDEAFEKAFSEKVDGHGTKTFGKSARAYVFTKDVIDATVKHFNENIKVAIDKDTRRNV